MNRRSFLLRAVSMFGAVAVIHEPAGAEHQRHIADRAAEDCARDCAASLIECARHVQHCTLLLADGQKEYLRCLQLCSACASACSACIQSCFSSAGPVSAEACGKVCDACAIECERFADDEAMQRCAKVCRIAARTCRAFAKNER